MKNKKYIVTLAALTGVVFASVPLVAYVTMLFVGLAYLTFASLILSVLVKLVWIGLFIAWMLPPVVQFCSYQFLVGFAEAVEILDKSKQFKKEDEDKLVKDMPEIPATSDKEVK